MTDWLTFFQFDLPVLAAAILASVACAIIGCFLVLRRMALMGDAISHAVLPGIVIAFLLTHTLHGLPMYIGCAAIGVLTALLTEALHRIGRVETNAAMGIVFTVLFAIGVILIEQFAGRHVHLDGDMVLYGALETVIWPTAPDTPAGLFAADVWDGFPEQVLALGVVLALNVAFIVILFKELRICAFDSDLAASLGFRPAAMHYLLMTMVAITTVAAFEAVGSILVVAMLIVPALIASLLTDRLHWMIIISAGAAVVAAAGGYIGVAAADLNAAGMIGVALGALLALTGLLAPSTGWVSRILRRVRLALRIAREDILAALFRHEERCGADVPAPIASLAVAAGLPAQLRRRAAGQLHRTGLVRLDRRDQVLRVALTPRGRTQAASLIRAHRLWETYLVEHADLRPDHVHNQAMQLEHVTDASLQRELAERTANPAIDPHGRDVPRGRNE